MTRFSVALHEAGVEATLEALLEAEERGVSGVWLTSASGAPLSIFAAAASRTRSILLGTAIIPLFSLHPMVLAQEAAAIARFSGGRFRLGVGPSHRPLVEGWLGLSFRRPLGRLREYVAVLRRALAGGEVDFEGQHYRVHHPFGVAAEVPVLISALRPRSFALAGEIADGAISWICPARYLRRAARPSLEEGARRAGRETPPLVAHCFLCVDPDPETVREEARRRLAGYFRLPFYRRMCEAAGLEQDELVEAVVIRGDEETCARRLREFAQEAEAAEVICSVMGDRKRALQLVAGL